MKNLYIMRHAAASHGTTDFDRHLNLEGRKQLEDLSIKALGLFDGVSDVLCSTAIRTRQTCAGLEDILSPSVRYHFLDSLYHAPASILLEELALLPATTRDVLIIAHNPGVSEFLGLTDLPISMNLGTAQIASFGVKSGSEFSSNYKDYTFRSVV